MCKQCKSSELGKTRQAELDAALAVCQHININPGIHGFIAKNAWKGHTPQYTDEQRAALDRYNAASSSLSKLHEDYVLQGMRSAHIGKRIQVTKERYKGLCGVIIDVGKDAMHEGCWLIKFDEKPAEWDSEVQWFLFGWIGAEVK